MEPPGQSKHRKSDSRELYDSVRQIFTSSSPAVGSLLVRSSVNPAIRDAINSEYLGSLQHTAPPSPTGPGWSINHPQQRDLGMYLNPSDFASEIPRPSSPQSIARTRIGEGTVPSSKDITTLSTVHLTMSLQPADGATEKIDMYRWLLPAEKALGLLARIKRLANSDNPPLSSQGESSVDFVKLHTAIILPRADTCGLPSAATIVEEAESTVIPLTWQIVRDSQTGRADDPVDVSLGVEDYASALRLLDLVADNREFKATAASAR